MNCFQRYEEENEMVRERYELCMERIAQIPGETGVPDEVRGSFSELAQWILFLKETLEAVCSGRFAALSVREKEEWNRKLFEDILPANYQESLANPQAAVRKLGKECGTLLTVLAAELRSMIPGIFEGRSLPFTAACELFIEIYNYFEEFSEYTYKDAARAVYYYAFDYCEDMLESQVREQLDPALTFAREVIMESDLSDSGYLYDYGCYISDNERKLAEYFAAMPEEEVQAMADTWTDGYVRGFSVMGADFSKKSIVAVRYCLGFERMVRAAVRNLEAFGKKVVFFRTGEGLVTRMPGRKIGFYATPANPQYDYDHRYDEAYVLNRAYLERKLSSLKQAYEKYRIEAGEYAGPCVLEPFGEEVFVPVYKEEAVRPDQRQLGYFTDYRRGRVQIMEEHIPSEETSYTIIAYPLPSIGDRFEEILKETRLVNNLDNQTWIRIQQCLIDTLDQGDYCTVKGANGNETDLRVMLYEISDPETQTIFENCTADVNIPVGEVFTSPKLTGTEGLLHVSHVSLNGLPYQDLKIRFQDGMITDYTCANFEREEDNKKYIYENILQNQETLPLGEFAIGTNTRAYAMGRNFQITDRLPILIAEKTGPHFAVGDTCYSHSEDHRVFNPDGREIAARENEVSALRSTEPEKAYFNCHTDITIPYHEIAEIAVHLKNGGKAAIIRGGKFVLPGTEELNKPLEED